jgi:hypothetical protein
MSSYSNLPKRILNSLIKTEKKIVSYPIDEKIKRLKEKYQDENENRELIVVDKHGNRYYQYYSHHGLPTRRVVLNNMKSFNTWDDDPFMLSWLQKRRLNPPTQEELEKMYIEQEEFQRRGLEWDKKEREMIEAWKNKQSEAIEKERKETNAIGEGDSFEPGSWDKKKKLQGNSYAERALLMSNQLVEVKDEEKRIVEGTSTLPGKYIMDLREEDEKWMKRREEKMLQPYLEMAKDINFSKYTFEAMNEKYGRDKSNKLQEIKNKQKKLTNLGKKMMEKKETYKNYSEFKERFKDVFMS